MFCEKEKKSKCPKKNFQSVERKKNVNAEFRVFGKKNGNWKKSSEKKNQSVFLDENLNWRILLSSYSLVGLYVRLQVKVTEKMMKISKVFFGWVFKVKIAIFAEKGKVKITVKKKWLRV